ncbi:RidA family protein [Sphaerisporangium sp. TRM90804]|uniref:RidA family protein n=1 Tax=Sphaerisporangium sp. TRM90804 TaxID=3031113 RepID=UPI0024468F25|nr:RidA family protein [Sphaerisporangium sp. TRM90804]MDH2427690.1 RidA family protein [Sphaerisporangium sp. TRM90804]
MTHIDFATPATLHPTPGYSHVASVPPGTRLVWTAGQVPIAPDGTVAPAGDWEAQARQAYQNLGAALEAGGATWADVIKLNIYVVDTSALPALRAVRDEFVNVDNPPTSTLIQVAGLFRPDILLEIEAIAAPPA